MTEKEFDKLCEDEFENSPERVDERFANTINRVEHESGHFIDEHYPYFKLISKIEYYSKMDKAYQKQEAKNKRKK